MGGFVAKAAQKLTGQEPPRQAQQVQQQAVRQEPKGPTAAEIDDLTTKQRLATNRRGRRATMLTSTKGVDEDITLGSKTLLG